MDSRVPFLTCLCCKSFIDPKLVPEGGTGIDTIQMEATTYGKDLRGNLSYSDIHLGRASITYTKIEQILLNLGEGNDYFLIDSTNDDQSVQVSSGIGNDVVVVGTGFLSKVLYPTWIFSLFWLFCPRVFFVLFFVSLSFCVNLCSICL
jgi:hypothetical protein